MKITAQNLRCYAYFLFAPIILTHFSCNYAIIIKIYVVKYNHSKKKGVKHYGDVVTVIMYAAIIAVISVVAYFIIKSAKSALKFA